MAQVEIGDSGLVQVGDGDAMTQPSETDRGDQTDVAGTEQEQMHVQGSPVIGLSDECPNLSIRRPPKRFAYTRADRA